MYGEDPLLTLSEIVPSEAPGQTTSVFDTPMVNGTLLSVKVAVATPVQPFSSVTVTLYWPCINPEIVGETEPLLQR